MRILVAYYSLNGNTKRIAQSIAEATGADQLEIVPRKERDKKPTKWGGLTQVWKGASPDLEDFGLAMQDYDLIFVGTPVWSYTCAPAVKAFLEQADLHGKKVALFCSFKGFAGKTFVSMSSILKDSAVLGEKGFREPVSGIEEQARDAAEWAQSVINAVH